VYSGPAFKDIEAAVFADHHFVKHVPVVDRPALLAEMERVGREYYITDYTAFESHMTAPIMEAVECEVYQFFLQRFPMMADTICASLMGVNKCTYCCGLSISTKARRMSGDMCTSLGNGLTNLFIGMYIIEEVRKIDSSLYQLKVEGDDGVIACPIGSNLSILDWKNAGFTIKLERVVKPGFGKKGVAFCGMNVVDGQNVRELVPFLCKFGWTLHESGASPARRRQLLKAKAMSALAESPQCPIVAVIAHTALSTTGSITPIFKEDGYHPQLGKFVLPRFAPSIAVREGYYQLTGISPVDQVRYEDAIRKTGCVDILKDIGLTRTQERYWAGWVVPG